MRRTLFFPLCLLTTLACEGRYILGQVRPGSAGASGVSGNAAGGDAGSSANSGTAGLGEGDAAGFTGEDAAGSAGTGDAGDAGDAGAAGSNRSGLGISPKTIPQAGLNRPYQVTFDGQGGTPGYTFKLRGGTLPAGLTLDESGRLSGTASEAGSFSFTIQVTDSANEWASASYELIVSRQRWLASQTFVSSASTQTVLSLVDLVNPQAEPIVLASQSGYVDAFSADGRWLLYSSARSASQADVYLVSMAGAKPAEAQFLFTNTYNLPCRFATDSSKLACLRDTGQADALRTELVYYDTSRTTPGPETLITTVPPKSAGASDQAERELVFLDANTLAYSYGSDDFARITWNGGTPSDPVPLGVGGGIVVQQATDGRRVLLKRTDPNSPSGTSLVDLKLGQAQLIDPKLQFAMSSSFEAGYALQPPAAGESGLGTYSYYSVDGVQLTRVGEEPVDEQQPLGSYPRMAGRTMVRLKQDRILTVAIRATDILEQFVPGDYQNLIGLVLDPTGTWIYFETAELDQQQHTVESTAKHWLSRLEVDGPAPAQLIAQGYSAVCEFSPDGRRLVLHGYATQSTVPVGFHLLDLSDPAHIQTVDLDLPYNWANANWSTDSAYVAFIGGAPLTLTRPLFVVDALAPLAAPRKIVECSSNPAPLPGCPSTVTFQP